MAVHASSAKMQTRMEMINSPWLANNGSLPVTGHG
jgi:hypothetical protein